MNKEHIPVLLEETIEYLNCQKEGIYIMVHLAVVAIQERF